MRTYLCTRKAKTTVTLTGTSGTANITIGTSNYVATFTTNLNTSAANFVTTNAATILTQWGIVVTNPSGANLLFAGTASGSDWKGTLGIATQAGVAITTATGDLNGIIVQTQYLLNVEVDAWAPTGAPNVNANISVSQIRDRSQPTASTLGAISLKGEVDIPGAAIRKVATSDGAFIAAATTFNFTLIACNNDYSSPTTKFTES